MGTGLLKLLPRSSTSASEESYGVTARRSVLEVMTSTRSDMPGSDLHLATLSSRTTLRRRQCGGCWRPRRRLASSSATPWPCCLLPVSLACTSQPQVDLLLAGQDSKGSGGRLLCKEGPESAGYGEMAICEPCL